MLRGTSLSTEREGGRVRGLVGRSSSCSERPARSLQLSICETRSASCPRRGWRCCFFVNQDVWKQRVEMWWRRSSGGSSSCARTASCPCSIDSRSSAEFPTPRFRPQTSTCECSRRNTYFHTYTKWTSIRQANPHIPSPSTWGISSPQIHPRSQPSLILPPRKPFSPLAPNTAPKA